MKSTNHEVRYTESGYEYWILNPKNKCASVDIVDGDIATIEALHDLLLDKHGYHLDFVTLKSARELTAKMYSKLHPKQTERRKQVIMPDISLCRNTTCPSRKSCYRYTAKPNKPRQSYGSFEVEKGKDKCEYYWDNNNDDELLEETNNES